MLRLITGFLLTLLLLQTPSLSRAQTSVYVEGGLAHYGFTHLSSSDVTFKADTPGIVAGLFYSFPIQSRVTVGLDARFGYSPRYAGGLLGAGALRVGFVPRRNPLRPYLQVGGGVVHSKYNETVSISDGFSSSSYIRSSSVTNGAFQLLFGLDIRLNEHWDLRAPEYGAEAGGGSGVHVGTGFLNAGLVYHL